MISIFYSTKKRNKKTKKKLTKSCMLKNVEVIEFENKNTHSLAQAYNMAIEQSKYEILVCIHDDVELEKGWDAKILNYFNTSDYGVLGFAGTTNMSDSGIWWQERQEMVGRVFHPNKNGRWVESKYSEKYANKILDVAVIDGLCMCIHKGRILENFDEKFKGFHFYDIPFCVANKVKGVKIGVVTDIKIKHDSIGVPNQQWYENKDLFVSSYQDVLPLKIQPEIHYSDKQISLTNNPKLGIVIPSKNNFEYLKSCIDSLLKTNYENYKIYLADTGSDEFVLNQIKEYLTDKKNVKLILFDYYNFAKINNIVVDFHVDNDTELLLFCNDDIVMMNDAISLMVEAVCILWFLKCCFFPSIYTFTRV